MNELNKAYKRWMRKYGVERFNQIDETGRDGQSEFANDVLREYEPDLYQALLSDVLHKDEILGTRIDEAICGEISYSDAWPRKLKEAIHRSDNWRWEAVKKQDREIAKKPLTMVSIDDKVRLFNEIHDAQPIPDHQLLDVLKNNPMLKQRVELEVIKKFFDEAEYHQILAIGKKQERDKKRAVER